MEDPSNIIFWEEAEVHNFFCGLGFKGYEQQIKEHQISGEILVQCDHEALKDVGIHSVGQRLAILKAVYQLKLQHDVPIEEGHWVPPSEFMDQIMVDSPSGVIPPDRMFELLRERDERIRSLESSILRISEQVNGMRDEVYGLNKALYTKEPPIPINKLRPNQASPTSSAFPKHLRNGSVPLHGNGSDGVSPAASPANSPVRSTHDILAHSTSAPSVHHDAFGGSALGAAGTAASHHMGGAGITHSGSLRRNRLNAAQNNPNGSNNNLLSITQPSASSSSLLSSDNPVSPSLNTSPLPSAVTVSPSNTANPAEPPTPTITNYLTNHATNGEYTPVTDTLPSALAQATMMTPSNLIGTPSSGRGGDGLGSAQRPATAQNLATSPGGTTVALPSRPSTSASALSSTSADAGSSTASVSSGTTEKPNPAKHASSSASSIEKEYKSFRVTLEDPCYRVLPAALKKYRINDDWRQYALFICYGTQERCLSYDEKPLLLFQKLKDSNQNPVFMLRHIKDIKSPIAVAHTKHAARREKRLKEGKHIIGEGKEGSIRDFTRATRLHHPTNLQPVRGSPNSPNVGTSGNNPSDDKDKDGKDKENKDDDKDKDEDENDVAHGLGYALAIYPYMADREDEFDVAVGDTFVILNKTKGWWVVHRDSRATNQSDIVRSGWVPQGCLLETSVPPSSFSTTPVSSATPINPLSIVSMSTPGIALMEYVQRGSDEINMKKGDKLRVFKRYNHWSYVIKEISGERGWTPSWFVGKLSSSSGSGSAQSTPTSALATGISNVSASSNTPNSATPLSAMPSASSASTTTGAGTSAANGNSLGDTTPTSATMVIP